MRSRAESRRTAEWVARGAAVALLAVALWRALASFGDAAPPRVHASAAGALEAIGRDSLAALSRAGFAVSWSGAPHAVAAMAEPVREPAAGWRISVVADTTALLADELGALDSLGAGGGAVRAAGVRGALLVRDGPTVARLAAPASVSLGRVLVHGRAGWEAKFVVAALEEQGWEVDARFRLGDAISVTQGNAGAPSPARHAAVVVLDSVVGSDAAAIARFVRAGGGLVMAGAGARAPALQALAPARAGRLQPAPERSFEGVEPRHALPLHPLTSLREDAVAIEARDGATAVAARRVGAGRVVQVGYGETWRWRMQGEGRSVEEHRAYWSGIVGAAAAARPVADDVAAAAASAPEPTPSAAPNAAPLAEAVQALGPALDAPPVGVSPSATANRLPAWLAPLILLLLVGEWASRRSRGAA